MLTFVSKTFQKFLKIGLVLESWTKQKDAQSGGMIFKANVKLCISPPTSVPLFPLNRQKS